MNSILENELPGIHNLRDQMLDLLTDQDLAYKLPGNNMTLGQLCQEMGRDEQIYTHSFRTLKQDWNYPVSKPASNTVASLREWYQKLDADLGAVITSLSEEDVQNKTVDRGHGFNPSLMVQFMIYHEATLIFYAKASIFLRALEKFFPDDWRIGIG